uniref:Zinc knuckle CX2CX4HX4C domain-containing protein n=1 Tax=Cajanus cajan TaxID=3821 RepID=A0A151SP92_CAJCA|nr:hypothetical protein KK1_002904 [Cajanus cajan]
MVEREGYAFYVSFEFDRLPLFCFKCNCIGHDDVACRHAGTGVRPQDTQKPNDGPRKSVGAANASAHDANNVSLHVGDSVDESISKNNQLVDGLEDATISATDLSQPCEAGAGMLE